MTEIILYRVANEVIEIVQDLRSKGLILGRDFDYYFIASKFIQGQYTPSYARFVFYNESLASWFVLLHH